MLVCVVHASISLSNINTNTLGAYLTIICLCHCKLLKLVKLVKCKLNKTDKRMICKYTIQNIHCCSVSNL